MRIVLCDDDTLLRSALTTLVAHLGHEVVGEAAASTTAIELLTSCRPDLLILDLALAFGSGFDVLATARDVRCTTIIFSAFCDTALLEQSGNEAVVVAKPDFGLLEAAIQRTGQERNASVRPVERRKRPARVTDRGCAPGLCPASVFFEAVIAARPDDALVSVRIGEADASITNDVLAQVRDSDLVHVSGSFLRILLHGGGAEGARILIAWLDAHLVAQTPGGQACSVLVEPGEDGSVAFERLKQRASNFVS